MRMQPPTSHLEANHGPNLEERLRAMALSNITSRPSLTLPEHAESGPKLFDTTSQVETPEYGEPCNSSVPTVLEKEQFPGRKRLNQAQRRQMSSQLLTPMQFRGVQDMVEKPHCSQGQVSHGNLNRQDHGRHHQHNIVDPVHLGRHPHCTPQIHTPRAQTTSTSNCHTGQGQQSTSGQVLDPWNWQARNALLSKPRRQSRRLYEPFQQSDNLCRQPYDGAINVSTRNVFMDKMVRDVIPLICVRDQEVIEKETFRSLIEQKCRTAISLHERKDLNNSIFDPSTVQLRYFGSMASGFAMRTSDMDLALLSPDSSPSPDSPHSRIPRILEKVLLDNGYGARLLTKARVPIIKLCESPSEYLFINLMEERKRWDLKSHPESMLADEDDFKHSSRKVTMVHQSKPIPESAEVRITEQQAEGKEYTEESFAGLKQEANQSLTEYYHSARHLLTSLGGHDLMGSAQRLDARQSDLLNHICRAFISGLASRDLSDRLHNYQSTSMLFDISHHVSRRSLRGVWNQAEGEELASAWNSRTLHESTVQRENECLECVKAWRTMQDEETQPNDIQTFERKIYLCLETLRTIKSIQLNLLRQSQHEDTSSYMDRTRKILDDLQADIVVDPNTATPLIVAAYITGIADESIRQHLQALDLRGKTLQQINLQHCALQLATDYERAIKAGTFSPDDHDTVRQYITLLKSPGPLSRCQLCPNKVELIARIRSLPDPFPSSVKNRRENFSDKLEFPKAGIGLQCDINFSALLAIQNTTLLRCYSLTDPRVIDMVLFIKHWAKARAINTPYHGTLSSYGYVLMVLHYLINVAQPFVCPNLQMLRCDSAVCQSPPESQARVTCPGHDVRFWRNEAEIKNLADRKMLNHNHDSVGKLLSGFFEYFAQTGPMSSTQYRGFEWTRHVLSLRTPGGILTKQEKGWTGAKTVVESTVSAPPAIPSFSRIGRSMDELTIPGCQPRSPNKETTGTTLHATKEVRHRYLFAIEDPFELGHNVGRTVTHNGIVSIRDEFRRAWRIIRSVGTPQHGQEGNILDAKSLESSNTKLEELLKLIHQDSMT